MTPAATLHPRVELRRGELRLLDRPAQALLDAGQTFVQKLLFDFDDDGGLDGRRVLERLLSQRSSDPASP